MRKIMACTTLLFLLALTPRSALAGCLNDTFRGPSIIGQSIPGISAVWWAWDAYKCLRNSVRNGPSINLTKPYTCPSGVEIDVPITPSQSESSTEYPAGQDLVTETQIHPEPDLEFMCEQAENGDLPGLSSEEFMGTGGMMSPSVPEMSPEGSRIKNPNSVGKPGEAIPGLPPLQGPGFAVPGDSSVYTDWWNDTGTWEDWYSEQFPDLCSAVEFDAANPVYEKTFDCTLARGTQIGMAFAGGRGRGPGLNSSELFRMGAFRDQGKLLHMRTPTSGRSHPIGEKWSGNTVSGQWARDIEVNVPAREAIGRLRMYDDAVKYTNNRNTGARMVADGHMVDKVFGDAHIDLLWRDFNSTIGMSPAARAQMMKDIQLFLSVNRRDAIRFITETMQQVRAPYGGKAGFWIKR